MYDSQKENIDTYKKNAKLTSRPEWGEQWDLDLMEYLDAKGPTSFFNNMLTQKAEDPCIVLGLASEEEMLGEFFKNVVGVNIAKDELMRIKKGSIDYNLIVCDAESLPFRNSCFKNVVSKAFLHHVDTLKEIKEISRITADKGFLYLWEPGKFNPIAFIARKFFPTSIHVKSEHPYNPSSLKKIVQENFGEIQYESYFHIFSVGITVLAKHWKFFKKRKLLEFVDKFDNFLMRLGLKNLCWVVVLGARKNDELSSLNRR